MRGHDDLSYTLNEKNKKKIVDEPQDKDSAKTRNEADSRDILFNLFGIELHFDDILLICLIFFLYNEGVKDEMLFISLILLLLS